MRIPPPIGVALNVGALVGGAYGWVVLLGIALPFSARRAWRSWRREDPGRDSWRPPVT
jgi:hypothetical protein